jgi:DNA-binding CsgD family transcriptional regulator
MPNPKPRHREAVAPANGAAVQLQQLMRTIITVTAANEPAALADGARSGAENVLIDTELDGMRYLLIRMPGTDHNRALLSPRELEIVRMVAQGHQNKIIAGILNISTWTVCAHVRRIFAKLGVSSRAAMVARLLQNNGLLKSSASRFGSDLRGHPDCDPIAELSGLDRSSRPTSERGSNERMTKRRSLETGDTEPRTVPRANAGSLSYKRAATV